MYFGVPTINPGSVSGRFGVESAWALSGRLTAKLSSLVVAALLARELARADYGAYLLVISVAGLFAFLADLGRRRSC